MPDLKAAFNRARPVLKEAGAFLDYCMEKAPWVVSRPYKEIKHATREAQAFLVAGQVASWSSLYMSASAGDDTAAYTVYAASWGLRIGGAVIDRVQKNFAKSAIHIEMIDLEEMADEAEATLRMRADPFTRGAEGHTALAL